MKSLSTMTKKGAKLNEENVKAIRLLLDEGKSLQFIAEKFGVHKSTISRLKTGILWGPTL